MAPKSKRTRPGFLTARPDELLTEAELRAQIAAEVGSRGPAHSQAAAATASSSSSWTSRAGTGRPAAPPLSITGAAAGQARRDFAAIRNVRRGGFEKAFQALEGRGIAELEHNLNTDREAASGRGGRLSLIGT